MDKQRIFNFNCYCELQVTKTFSTQANCQQAEKQQAKQVADKPTEQPVETVSKQEI